ncbi:hypothetical protein [Paenibacillus vini]|uniref:Uncharacterized protein n=1 Tax=Paenibacillus vini TaxID=1476024 RepID=A0ABQ4MIY1_9BACL|nr:hypothetical protein [Paenibacillus vini]GIP55936.1 hypothetical protein J42TS3_49710 [Paenibacillus vini]
MSRDWQLDMERCKDFTSMESKSVYIKALEYWLQQYAAEKERGDKAEELLKDALGCMVMFAGINEHTQRIAAGMASLYPKEEEA